MSLTVWHYGKGKTVETLKGWPGLEGVEVEDEDKTQYF